MPPPTAADVGGATETTGSTSAIASCCPTRPICRRRPSRTSRHRRLRLLRQPRPRPSRRLLRQRRPRRLQHPPVVAHRRSADPRRAARVRRQQQQARPHRRPQGRPHRGRGVLFLARLRAALGRHERRDRSRAPRHQSPAQRRRRRHGPGRLSGADDRRRTPRPPRSPKPRCGSTESVLDYARHAQIGRVHYSRVSGDITYDQIAPEPLDVLSKLATARTPPRRSTATSRRSRPTKRCARSSPRCAATRATASGADRARPRARSSSTDKKTKQTILMQDERVPALREKLGLAGRERRPVLRQAARRRGRAVPEGQGTARQRPADQRRRVDALNGKRHERDDQIIIANMERWRWVPRDLGKAHVVLNVPDFTLRVYNNGASIWKTKVVVGKPGDADAAALGDDEVHHRQPDLERAAVDRLQRIPAGPAAGPDRAQAHGPEPAAAAGRHGAHLAAAGRRQRARAHPLQLPEQVPGLSARHAGQAPVRARPGAPTATAACGWRTRPSTPRS